MKDLEITEIASLTAAERSLVDLHSLLNIFNVLKGELTLIGLNLNDEPGLLKEALETCDLMISVMHDPVTAPAAAGEVTTHIRLIQAAIRSALREHPDQRQNPEIVESLSNLETVFAVLRARSEELLARLQAPDQWVRHNLESLRRNFLNLFSAIERNSHGRYRLIYNVALKQPPDYYIDFRIESADDDSLLMPPVFQDVMRDLIANARKYTAHGGRITAALFAALDAVYFHVEDTGRGIPADELATVIEFGRRGSNVSDVRTMGGGFGLTKAFLVTKQFGGRFWIASEVGIGTRIRIQIPRPQELVTGLGKSAAPWEDADARTH